MIPFPIGHCKVPYDTVGPAVHQFYQELSAHGVRLRPPLKPAVGDDAHGSTGPIPLAPAPFSRKSNGSTNSLPSLDTHTPPAIIAAATNPSR